MAEFTPTTEQVRAAWQAYVGMSRNTGPEFDRWLASIESAAERRGAVKALRAVADERRTSEFRDYLARSAAEFESGERDLP